MGSGLASQETIQLLVIAGTFIGGSFFAVRSGMNQASMGKTQPIQGDDEPSTLWQRVAERSSRLTLALLILSILGLILWYMWPLIQKRLSTNADQTSGETTSLIPDTTDQISGETSTPEAADSQKIYIEEPIASWQTSLDSTYNFAIRFPTQWAKRPATVEEIKYREEILDSFELYDRQNEKFFIRVHVENNSQQFLASSFASVHPMRGSERTPFTLHGARAIKYKTALPNKRQNRLTIFAPTTNNAQIIVASLYSPIEADEFSTDYTRAERILMTLTPQPDLVQSEEE